MKGSVTIIVLLAIAVAGLIGVHWLILPDPSQRNYEFLPDMVESPARDAQSPPFVLDDGTAVDFRPPPGSIARGYLPFDYPASPEGALAAGAELVSPIAEDDADAVARGAVVFTNFCAVCHGAGGRGDGTVTLRGVPPPPSLLLDHAVDMSDGQMYHLITLGQGNMASYASQVDRADRWRVIRYVRSLQAGAVASAAAASTPPPASAGGAPPAAAHDSAIPPAPEEPS